MSTTVGIDKPELHALPLIRDRLSFLYLERSIISRHDNAITVTDARGTVHVPAAALGVLLLGPGTTVSHRAMELIGDSGTSTVWVGERGVRYYAHGRSLTHSSRLLVRQADLVSNVRTRIVVARKMYQMRFPDEDVSSLTMQQLRGREGSRVRAAYRHFSKLTGVPWRGRSYDPGNFEGSDPVNMALSAANACLYGALHSVIVALGCSPGLGFVHSGHDRSFVYDIADLYKTEFSVPIAFEIAAEHSLSAFADIGSTARRRLRDTMSDGKLFERTVKDIRLLLLGDSETLGEAEPETLRLWDGKDSFVSHGVAYGKDTPGDDDETQEDGYGTICDADL